MKLEQYHIDYIKKVLEDSRPGIEGKPIYDDFDYNRTNTYTVRYSLESNPLIGTELVLSLLKKGLWIVWCGCPKTAKDEKEQYFEIAISTADEWMSFE